ncbi:MAG: hypothetical protein ACREPX_10630 [Rhodanobacteraceae bacterium]
MGLLFSVSASAQTCGTPSAWQPDAAGTPAIAGDTCSGETNNGGGFCGGTFDAPGPAYVIQSTFNAAGSYTNVTVSGATGFTPALYVTATCGANGACIATGDGTNPLPNSAIPDAGTFYIIVTAASFDAPGACGTFTLTSDGSFPVQLQSFSVG